MHADRHRRLSRSHRDLGATRCFARAPGRARRRRGRGLDRVAAQANAVLDVTPDRRNSFPLADEQLLRQLPEQLLVTVHMASSDPRLTDLDRKVLARLKRAMPRVTRLHY